MSEEASSAVGFPQTEPVARAMQEAPSVLAVEASAISVCVDIWSAVIG